MQINLELPFSSRLLLFFPILPTSFVRASCMTASSGFAVIMFHFLGVKRITKGDFDSFDADDVRTQVISSGPPTSQQRNKRSSHFCRFNNRKKIQESTIAPQNRGRTAMEDVAADATRSSDGFSSAANGGVTVEECQKMLKKSLRTPMVKFLREHLTKSGCHIGDDFIKAVKCTNKVSGGYARGVGIMVCSNNVDLQDEVNQVVIHELIHAYDDCRAGNMEWTNCAHHVCSEIRAGHLSGDCHFKRELLRGYMKLRGHEQDCVKRRVMMSMANNPYCSEAASKDAMEAVWDVCYNDTKPFDRAP